MRLESAYRPLIAATLLSALLPGPVAAQAPGSHSISGIVIDAATGEALPGSVVVLAPLPEGILGDRGSSTLVPSGWSTTTIGDGSYLFRGLTGGEYALFVSRLDYKPARVDVELVASRARVSVGLIVDPITMESREVLVRSTAPVGRATADATLRGTDRGSLEKDRQTRFLGSDARIVTAGDVRDAVTLAETDLFRALQRLPGVTTRDDFTAELWTRGAPWSHTRIYFDGIPLLNPLHGVGMFSAVNPDAVGAVFFHPGARPARFGEGAAAVVDVSTRPTPADTELGGRADLSLLSARGALERGFGAGGGWMIAGRRSYLDLVSLVIEKLGGGSDVHVPYDFHDVTGRVDLPLGERSSLEASALWQQDAVRGEIPAEPDASRSRWGNAAGRVTFDTPRSGLRIRHTVGGSHFYARGLKDPEGETAEARQAFTFPWEDPTRSTLDVAVLEGEIGPLQGSPSHAWGSGYALIAQRQRYRGPAPTPYPGRTTLRHVALDQELQLLAAWAERRWRLAEHLEIETGVRAETGSAVQDAGRLRLAPRVSARRQLGGSAAYVSAGWARSWQYTQTVSPVGLSVGPRLHPSDLWILAGDSLPALRSDVVTLGGEGWLGSAWLASATGWVRSAENFLVPPPDTGPVVDDPIFVEGTNKALGIELSLRRLVGPWTGSVSYTLSRSKVEADGRSFPAASDRRHALDAAVIGEVARGVRAGGALAWSTGAAFTRFFPATLDCDFALESCRITESARVEDPNAERTTAYASVDALIEWTTSREGWDLTVYGQVRNLLGRRNAITYLGSRIECGSAPIDGACPDAFHVVDEFDRGLPRLPAVGLRVSF